MQNHAKNSPLFRFQQTQHLNPMAYIRFLLDPSPPPAYKRITWIFFIFEREKFCFGVFVPLENFSLIWKRHHYQ